MALGQVITILIVALVGLSSASPTPTAMPEPQLPPCCISDLAQGTALVARATPTCRPINCP
ncbi:hypothetical protein NEOLEDRAFT_1143181 [Neolentinus lepideus HHB14362 ss-1]|uniref:Uncharacterized protein n=1 Tax=Neolentinus lepideus HHB14362 ss-1 TaxID=1314782 RepID=A0A165MPC1_9AGAM|nr:hypothetical protein NEOLEDRAFT_1143181 [Neolentinus lepideus HHB14362 ss-1]